MRTVILSTVLLALLNLAACTKEEADTSKPELTLVNPNNEDVFMVGESFKIQSTVTDNKDLSQVKVEVHENFDGHDHNKKSVELYFSEIKDITGTTSSPEFEIEIPINTSTGPYHVTAKAIDAEGNESNTIERSIYISGPSQPQIKLTNYNLAEDIIIKNGSMQLIGEINDEDGLEELHILITSTTESDHKFEFEKELEGTLIFDLQEVPVINTSDWANGSYQFRMFTIDENGNANVKTTNLLIQ